MAAERALFLFSRLSPVNLVLLVRLDGVPDDDALALALAAIQERHPLLRARISGRPARPRFDISPPGAAPGGPGPIPLRILRGGPAGAVTAVVQAEMGAAFDTSAGPLARLTCVRGSGQAADLVLALHHCIADGASAANLVHELLDWCRARAAGDTRAAAPAAMPPPLTDVLPAASRGVRGARHAIAFVARQGRDELAYRHGSRRARRPVPAAGQPVASPVSLDPLLTAAVVDRARRRRLTLTSLLGAALLWQASAALYGSRRTVMRAVIWVDLRPYLDPPVDSQTLGCYISMLRLVVPVDPGRGFDALAADVQELIERAARRGDRIPAALLSAAMTRVAVRWPASRLGTIALSYAAAPGIEPSYGPITVRDVQAFVSNSRLGAELAATSGIAGGALWCNLLYLDSDFGPATATAVTDGLLATLADFARA